MSRVMCSNEVRGRLSILLQKELFQGTQKNALVLPMKEKLNIVDKPDRDVKAIPPSKYAKKEKELLEKAFLEVFNSVDD